MESNSGLLIILICCVIWLDKTRSSTSTSHCNPWSMHECGERSSGGRSPNANSTLCIPLSWRCDSEFDCWNNSDEEDCYETLTCLKSLEFGCHDNSRCLPINWLCDGESDCLDKSDEDPKICNSFNCTIDQFTCIDGNGTKRCLPLSWVCDGTHDCINDEANCNTTCTPNEFTCPSGKCINSHWTCDGNNDCLDAAASDEINCTGREAAKTEEFNCTLGEIICNDACVPTDWSCDLPIIPTTTIAPTTVTTFTTIVYPCDPSTHYMCTTNKCIPKSSLCNQVNDCDWEDEANCHTDECLTNNGNCTHLCVDTPNGHHCSCHLGFKMVNDTCRDINECKDDSHRHNCSQLCLNEVGTFKCECYDGYLKDPLHPWSCKSVEGHASLLYYYQGSIRKLSLDHLKMTLIVDNIRTRLTSIDYQFRTGMIFWNENWFGTGLIYKSPIDEGNTNKIQLHNLTTSVYEIALDWVNYHLYVITKNTIKVSTLDGKLITNLIEFSYTPKSLILNPLNGWMYWLTNCSIMRATMDGQNISTVLNLKSPQSLTIDYLLGEIYYVDAMGLHVHAHNKSRLIKPIVSKSITIFEDWIYIYNLDGIRKINKLNGKILNVQNLYKPLRGMKLYHTYRQGDNSSMSSCQPNHCSHLCLPNPFTYYSCHCPEGLLNNGMSCVAMSKIPPKTNFNVLLLVAIGGIGCLSGAIVLILYRRNHYTKMMSTNNAMSSTSSSGIINFDNPVYHNNSKTENPKILSLLSEESDEISNNPMVLSGNEYV